MEEAVTKEDLDHVHSRIERVEKFLEHVLHKIEQTWLHLGAPAAAAAAAIVEKVAAGTPAAAVARVVETVAGAVQCPDHPDAKHGCPPGCPHLHRAGD